MVESSDERSLPDIFLVGAGIQIPWHLTLEAVEVLDLCQEIYTIFPPSSEPFLPGNLAPKVRSLWPLYKPGLLRQDVYLSEIETVLEAVSRHKPVACLTPGHPLLFDSVAQGILTEGVARGLDVRLVPGLSSIDTILVDLKLHIAPGLQIYDATSLLLHQIEPRNDIPCILMQPHVFGTAYVAIGHLPLPAVMADLRDYLLQYYPPEHEVIYVTSSQDGSVGAELNRFPLHSLGGTESEPQVPGASLFIPPAREPVVDAAFAERMFDAASFLKSYRQRDPSATD